jgi:hypothetical protein
MAVRHALMRAILGSLLAVAACGETTEYCRCRSYNGTVRIVVPDGSWIDFAAVHGSGPGCSTGEPLIHDAYAGGLYLPLSGAGNCHVEIAGPGGTKLFEVDRSVSYQGDPECCGGFAADPIFLPPIDGGSLIEVPDAGPRPNDAAE